MHLYVHVPFCARRCSYCDFSIAVRREVPSDAFGESVLVEWADWQANPAWHSSPAVDTVYFGGGTPSRLAPAAIARILDRIRADRPLAEEAEITLEANPDDISGEVADQWVRAGVNRVSLGVQSFDPAILAWMHRVHTVEQTFSAVGALRAAGVRNLSLDLIFALPESLERDWPRDLDAAFGLAPDHLSLYGLTIEPRTPLGRWADRGDVAPAPDERYAMEYLEASARLHALGWDHYEVSNAARPGYRSRHNSAYWRRAPFIGLGPSAHSGLGASRRWNEREWEAYARRGAAGGSVVAGAELIGSEALRLEEIYLGLRTADGLPLGLLDPAQVDAWRDQGWARVGGGRVRLTIEGWLRLDAIVAAAR